MVCWVRAYAMLQTQRAAVLHAGSPVESDFASFPLLERASRHTGCFIQAVAVRYRYRFRKGAT